MRGVKASWLVLVSLLVLLLVGGGVVRQWLRKIPRQEIVACQHYRSHGHKLELTLSSGEKWFGNFAEIEHPERCPPNGSFIEKRRFEFGTRLSDGPPYYDVGNVTGPAAVCVVMIGAVAAFILVQRRQKARE